MSGVFRDEQNLSIEATDDPELAKAHGLTQFDKATGQYRRPAAPDAGERDSGEVAQLQRDKAALEQHAAELRTALDEARELLPEDKAKPTKATGGRASQSKDTDGK